MTTSSDSSNIHMRFLNLVDRLLLLLSQIPNLNLLMIYQSLRASEVHCIPLFSEKMVEKINNCKSLLLHKVLLLPYITWLDHSILQCLVESSQNMEANNILKDFISSIDYSQLITSYPIASTSRLMIPLDDNDYTLVATKCEFEFKNMLLEKVVDIRNVLIHQWKITPYAIQFVAVHVQERLLYWMIPKSVAGQIADRTPDIHSKLWKSGIVTCTIFPVDFFLIHYDEAAFKSDPFSFLSSKVMCFLCIFLLDKAFWQLHNNLTEIHMFCME